MIRANLGRMRLLLVEDEVRLGRALARGLGAEGFVVDIALDGVDGLERARHGQYDAIVLDVMLPRLSGYRVVHQLRAEENWTTWRFSGSLLPGSISGGRAAGNGVD